MKYFFVAIAFFSIGYILPTFPPFLQLAFGASVVLFLSIAVYYYIDTRVFAVRLHQNAVESVPERYL